jgi:hypothetical protein
MPWAHMKFRVRAMLIVQQHQIESCWGRQKLVASLVFLRDEVIPHLCFAECDMHNVNQNKAPALHYLVFGSRMSTARR